MTRSDAIANCKSLKQFGVHVAGHPYQKSMIQRTSVSWRFWETPRRHLAQLTFMLEVNRRAGVRANSSDLCVS